jgi:hypothetical protein
MGFPNKKQAIEQFKLPEEIVTRNYISVVGGLNGNPNQDKYFIYDNIYKYLWYSKEERLKNQYGYLLKQFENQDVFIINARGNSYCFYNCLYMFLCIINHKDKENYSNPIDVIEELCELYSDEWTNIKSTEDINKELAQMRDPSTPSVEYFINKYLQVLRIKIRIIDLPQINTMLPDAFDIIHNGENGKYDDCCTLIQNAGHFFIVLPYIINNKNMCDITVRVKYEFEKPDYTNFHKRIINMQTDPKIAVNYITKQTNLKNSNRKILVDRLFGRKLKLNEYNNQKIKEYLNPISSSGNVSERIPSSSKASGNSPPTKKQIDDAMKKYNNILKTYTNLDITNIENKTKQDIILGLNDVSVNVKQQLISKLALGKNEKSSSSELNSNRAAEKKYEEILLKFETTKGRKLNPKEKIGIIEELNTSRQIKDILLWNLLPKNLNVNKAKELLSRTNISTHNYYKSILSNRVKSQIK